MNKCIYLSACLRINAQSLLEALHHLPHVVARQLLHGVQAGLAVHALHHKGTVHFRLLHGPAGVIFQVPERKVLGLPKRWRCRRLAKGGRGMSARTRYLGGLSPRQIDAVYDRNDNGDIYPR